MNSNNNICAKCGCTKEHIERSNNPVKFYHCDRGCNLTMCSQCVPTILPSRQAYSNQEGWRTFSSRRGHTLYACSLSCYMRSDLED